MSNVTHLDQARPSAQSDLTEPPTLCAANSLRMLRGIIEDLTHTACEALDLGNPARDEIQGRAYEAIHQVRRAENAIQFADGLRDLGTPRPLARGSLPSAKACEFELGQFFESARERINDAAAAFVLVDGAQIHASDDYADPAIRGDFSVALARLRNDLAEIEMRVGRRMGEVLKTRDDLPDDDAHSQAAEE
jgi:hypothetical protein